MAPIDSSKPPLPDALLEQAAIWHVRMPEPGSEMRAAFEDWLHSDPAHARAYEETARLWTALAGPVAQVVARENSPMIRPRTQLRYGALAASLLLITAAISWRFGVVDDLRTDHVTAIGQQAPIDLADGSSVILNTDTAFKVNLHDDRRAVTLFRGEAWFDVAKDETRPFTVDTPNGSVRVTGTSFDVRIDGEKTIVSLTSGQVELTSPGASSPTTLEPGQQAHLLSSGISVPAAFDATATGAWRRGQIVFYDASLNTVVKDLNRYRKGRIVIANGALDGLKVSGVFRTDDPDAALTVIARTLPVRITNLTDYLVLLR